VPQVGHNFVEVAEFSVVICESLLKAFCWLSDSGDDYTSLLRPMRIDLGAANQGKIKPQNTPWNYPDTPESAPLGEFLENHTNIRLNQISHGL